MNKNTKPCMRIKLTSEKPDIFDSKAGGLGYVPHDMPIPCDSKGNQLRLLAQIDCSKIELEEYPEKGLLQFWVLNDDVCGLDFDNPTNQNTFRILYHKDVDRTVTESEIAEKTVNNSDDDYFPVRGEFGMNFVYDTDVEQVYNDDTFEEDYDDIEGNFGHKAGGFPDFTQSDPREDMPNGDSYDFLLFQLDSDYCEEDDDKEREYVLWGDMGIANFFINTQKLKNCDFSDVLYNWDCY